MASTPSMLTDGHAELALDASVLINVLGTGSAETVLAALARPVLIAQAAYAEVRRDPFSNLPADKILSSLQACGLITRCELDAAGTKHMVSLIGASGPDALDDGEAATIALGASRGCSVVIDEVRGRRIANGIPVAAGVLNTLDLLACNGVKKALGEERFKECILNAARYARMRFPNDCGPWAESLLGETVARELSGLRAYYRSKGVSGNV